MTFGSTHPRSAHGIRRRGLTLLELLLAIAGTAVVGVAAASLLTGVEAGEKSTLEARELLARQKAVSARFSAALRESRQVLDVGSGFVVLWVRDLDNDLAPDLLEIRRLDYDAATDILSVYQPPAGTSDVQYGLTDDFETITDALMGTASFPQTPWSTGITQCTWSLNNADAALTTVVTLRATLQVGTETDECVVVARLRNAS